MVGKSPIYRRTPAVWCTTECRSLEGSTQDRMLEQRLLHQLCLRTKQGGRRMRVLYERCCGLDVHKQSITACALTPEGKEIRTFSTMTDDLDFRLSKASLWLAFVTPWRGGRPNDPTTRKQRCSVARQSDPIAL